MHGSGLGLGDGSSCGVTFASGDGLGSGLGEGSELGDGSGEAESDSGEGLTSSAKTIWLGKLPTKRNTINIVAKNVLNFFLITLQPIYNFLYH